MNQCRINGAVYSITQAELHLIDGEVSRTMYLGVVCREGPSFGLWEVELAEVESVDGLDGGRIHVRADGTCFDDDTLGTDVVSAYEQSDLNYLSLAGTNYGYGEILADFVRVGEWRYRVRLEMHLTDRDEDPAELPAEAFSHRLRGEFEVTADEDDPCD